jgi:hypothetical protein
MRRVVVHCVSTFFLAVGLVLIITGSLFWVQETPRRDRAACP